MLAKIVLPPRENNLFFGRSTSDNFFFMFLLTLACEKSTGQSAALYLKRGACDHNNNARPADLDLTFANKGCFWHRFISSQSKTISGVYHGKEGCVFVNQNRQWQEQWPTNLGHLCCSPEPAKLTQTHVTRTHDTWSSHVTVRGRCQAAQSVPLHDSQARSPILVRLIR